MRKLKEATARFVNIATDGKETHEQLYDALASVGGTSEDFLENVRAALVSFELVLSYRTEFTLDKPPQNC